jgi:acyl carrier protein
MFNDSEKDMYKFEQLITQVIAVVRTQLKDHKTTITATTCLYDLPGFDSLVVAGVLEQLEEDTQIEMDPALIVPESFVNPHELAVALLQSERRDIRHAQLVMEGK